MRILYIVHQFLPEFSTGTERVTLNLAKAAQRANHYVEILTCSIGPAELWRDIGPNGWRRTSVQGIPVHAIPSTVISDPYGFDSSANTMLREAIGQFLDARNFDLVHVTHAMRMLDAVEAVRLRQIPYVMTLTDFFSLCYRINLKRLNDTFCEGPAHAEACKTFCMAGDVNSAALNRRYARLRDVLFAAEDRIACSEFVATAYAQEFPSLQMRVIGHGIDLLRFPPPRQREPSDELVFGYLGTLSEFKGVLVLAEAFVKAALPNARLELIGSFYGSNIEGELRRLAQNNKQVRLLGPVDAAAVPSALARFDVNCLPALQPETFSLVLHEGFAAGLPPLASEVGNIAEVVRRTGCGRLVPPGNVSAWRDAIIEIASRPELLDQWREHLPLPMRREEESFLYDQIYQFAQRRESRKLGCSA